MKFYLIILMSTFIFLSGCAVKTTIISPQNEVWIVKSKKDSLVTLKRGDFELTVNNQGKMGIVESIFGALIMKADINLSNKEGRD